ncbi:acyl-CoA thioesterase [Arhodomonas sp. AD133]|uniref:acyl-CoA thioesterase n=1 Tax=Arhodomonas sp. AD133 TaxID=3415009 RepID=UPI003EB7E91A
MSETTLLIESELSVRWADMDALGHVNNTVYFRYFEQARIEWLAEIGAGSSVGHGSDTGPVIVNAYCEFMRSITYPARLRVRMLGGAPGRSSFETHYEIVDADRPDVTYSVGTARMVWVDHGAGKSVPVPDDVRARLPQPAP